MVMIISLSNPLVKQARALRQKKIRAETGLFLVEGIHHVGEAIEAGWEIQSVLFKSARDKEIKSPGKASKDLAGCGKAMLAR